MRSGDDSDVDVVNGVDCGVASSGFIRNPDTMASQELERIRATSKSVAASKVNTLNGWKQAGLHLSYFPKG